MSDVMTNGMNISLSVLDTIIALAVKDVKGVVGLTRPTVSKGLLGMLNAEPEFAAVEVREEEDGALSLDVHIDVYYGFAMNDLAEATRSAVARAVELQVGAEVSSVDVFVDNVCFAD